jgi:DNA-binding protein H-NS
MPTLNELMAQKEPLERQIEHARRTERADAIARVHALMAEHGLTLGDVGAKSGPARSRKTGAGSGRKAPVKYRNKASGETWSGRGLQPKWLRAALAAGRKIDEFAV